MKKRFGLIIFICLLLGRGLWQYLSPPSICKIYEIHISQFKSDLQNYDRAIKSGDKEKIKSATKAIEFRKWDSGPGIDRIRSEKHKLSEEQVQEFEALEKRLGEFKTGNGPTGD